MNYTEWKQEYLELLIELIKQHEYSKNYTQDYIDELVIELLERGGFFEDFNWWKEVSPKKASKESFKLWLADYFEEQTMDIQKILEQHKMWIDSHGEKGKRADLREADCTQTILPKSTFIILGEYYFVSICGDCVRAGCQSHLASEWRQFSMHDISKMHGLRAIRFYPRLLDIIDFYCGKGERPEWLKERNNG